MTDAPRTVRAAVGMGAITALSRAVGFVRVLVVAAVLGATYLGNAFQSANSLSNVVFELVAAGALSSVLVPVFVDLLRNGEEGEAEQVAGGVLGVAMAGLGALALAGMAAAPLLARLLTLGVPAEVAQEQRDLVTFLLLFFLPQIVLYAAGTVATGALHAKRRFLAAAAAPMANTAVMVACLVAFRSLAGADPGLALTGTERLLLAAAGTGGVIAFTGVLVLACGASGFRLRPHLRDRHPRVAPTLRQAGWGVVLHTSAGVLLAGAIIAGAAVEGGVVAYQVAWVFFLAPYAIFSQPIHTAILPELVPEAAEPGLERFATSVRWSLERIALPIAPVSVLMVVLAAPGMRLVSFGEAAREPGPELLAASLGALAIGLLPYGAFLLLARAFYALDDSRTPGRVALGVAAIGALVMAVGAPLTEGTARIAVIGLAHTVAHVAGALVLARLLARRTGHPVGSSALAVVIGVAAAGGLVGAGAVALVGSGEGRASDLLTCAVAALAAGAAFVGLGQLTGVRRRLTVRRSPVEAAA
jgi:putative peptidoglycan lipid II flippase